MAEYDGSIRIGTGLDTKEFKAGSKELEVEARRMAESVSKNLGDGAKIALQKQTDAFVKANQQYATQEQKVEELKNKLKEMAAQKIETPAFKEIGKQIEADILKLSRLTESQRRFVEGGGEETSPVYKRRKREIEELQLSIAAAEAEQKELLQSGEAYQPVDTSKVTQKLESAQTKLQQMYSSLQTSADALTQKTSALAAEEERIAQIRVNAVASNDKIIAKVERIKQLEQEIADLKAAERTEGYADYDNRIRELQQLKQDIKDYRDSLSDVPEKFSKMRTAAQKAFSAISSGLSKIGGVGKRAFSSMSAESKKSNASLSGSLKTMLKYGLGIRSLYVLFNKLRSAAKEGFSNLAQYSIPVNGSISMLISSLTRLKNSLATAFAPIVTTVAPLLKSLIDMLSHAATQVGMFIAALTGSRSFTKAVAVQQDYAKSLDKTAGAAKKAAGALARFDDLDVFQKQDDAGGGAAELMPEDMFEEVPIESDIESLADKTKSILSQLFAPLQEAWENQGQFVMDSWRYALEEIGLLAKSVGSDFLEVWNQPETISVLENILIIVGDIGLVAGNLAGRFREAWETNDIGLSILKRIRNIFGNIVGHIRGAADATVEWSKSIDFYPLLKSINNLLKSLEPLTDNIGAGLKWFWNNVLLPVSGWVIEDAVPTFLDMLSTAIDAVNKVIEVLKPYGEWLWNNFLQPLAEWTGGAIVSIMEGITNALTKVGNWISEHSESIQAFLKIVTPIAGVVLGISLAISALSLAFTLLTSPVTLIIAALAALAAGFVYLYESSEGFRKFIDGIIETAGEIIPGIMEGIAAGWNAFIDWIKGLWQSIIDWFKDIFGIHSPSTVMEEMGTFLMEGLLGGIKSLIDTVVGAIQDVWDGIKEVFNGFMTFLTGVFTGDWEKAWDGIKDFFSGIADVIKGIIDGIIGAIMGIIDAIKSALEWFGILDTGIGKITLGAGQGAIVGGGSLVGMADVSGIPALANGAVLRGGNPFMAILGDQPAGHTNIEAPLATIEQAVENVLSRQGYGNEPVPVIINLNYDGETFARVSLSDILSEAAREGLNVDVLGVT